MAFTQENLDYWNEEWKKDYDVFNKAYLVPELAVWELRKGFLEGEVEQRRLFVELNEEKTESEEWVMVVQDENAKLQKENAELKKRIEGITDLVQATNGAMGTFEARFWEIANPPQTSDEGEDVD